MRTVTLGTDSAVQHVCTVSIEPITDELRARLLAPAGIPDRSEWAIVATAGDALVLLATDAEVINVWTAAKAFATELRGTFNAPEATCGYCARPVAADTRYCPPATGRNCEHNDAGNETTWRNERAAVA